MNNIVRALLIWVFAMFMIWLYIINCLFYGDYEFIYSEDKPIRAFQYVIEGLWTVFTFFGWIPMAALIMTVILIAFPKSFKDFR